MKNISITLNETDMDHTLTAIEAFLEMFEDDMDEDHPHFAAFQNLQDLQGRISAKFRE